MTAAPELSIITVCFRAKTEIQATIESILSQTWTDFEYLVIDGGSDDGTKELLEQSSGFFAEKNLDFRFVSEPDRGIYDAMNKGSLLARGKWLLFLNAGDLFADNTVLEYIFSKPSNAHIIYGDTICIYQGQKKLYPALPLEHLTYEMAFCHQSVFVLRELMLAHPYDISYKVCADHYFFLTMYLDNRIFEYRPIPVSLYEISGYSDKNKLLSHKEKQRMQKELGIFHFSFSWLLRECSFYFKQSLKQIFGQKLIDTVRKSRLH